MTLEPASQGVKLLRFDGEEPRTIDRAPSAKDELKHFRNVTGSVTQDAMNVWSEIWGELQEGVHDGVAIAPEANEGFKPSCGWPEFMEKMWLLRHYLDFMDRFSRQ